MSELHLDRSATPEETAAIAAAVGAYLAAEQAQAAQQPTCLNGWHVAARIESLGIVRRIPGKLDLCYMGPATRERMSRPHRSK